MDAVDQECEKSKAGVACLCLTTLDAQQDLLRWLGKPAACPHPGFRPRWFESYGLEHLCVVQTSYNMLIGVPKNEHSKRTKQNLYGLLWPSLGIHVASFHYGHKLFCAHKWNTYSDSFWDVGRWKSTSFWTFLQHCRTESLDLEIKSRKTQKEIGLGIREATQKFLRFSSISHRLSFQFHFSLSKTEIGIIRRSTHN